MSAADSVATGRRCLVMKIRAPAAASSTREERFRFSSSIDMVFTAREYPEAVLNLESIGTGPRILGIEARHGVPPQESKPTGRTRVSVLRGRAHGQ